MVDVGVLLTRRSTSNAANASIAKIGKDGKPKLPKKPASVPLMALHPNWVPRRQADGTIVPEGRLWEFVDRLSKFRREGKKCVSFAFSRYAFVLILGFPDSRRDNKTGMLVLRFHPCKCVLTLRLRQSPSVSSPIARPSLPRFALLPFRSGGLNLTHCICRSSSTRLSKTTCPRATSGRRSGRRRSKRPLPSASPLLSVPSFLCYGCCNASVMSNAHFARFDDEIIENVPA